MLLLPHYIYCGQKNKNSNENSSLLCLSITTEELLNSLVYSPNSIKLK